MAYNHYIYKFANSNEHEYKYKGNYGAKGEKRKKKKKATPEQIKKQNQINRENRVRRIMKANWKKKDLWCCFKYPKGTRIPIEQVIKDRIELFKILREEYKRRGFVFKYYSRLEIGELGGIHFHVLINRMWSAQTDVIISDAWSRVLEKSYCSRNGPPNHTDGLVDFKTTYEAGGFHDLANYLVKIPETGSEEYEQLSLFDEKDQKKMLSITSSRNLIRPEPEKHEYHHWTMRKILTEGPKPTPGYYIDKNSLYQGINRYTGMSYLKYTEIRIQTEGRASPGGEYM